MTASQMQLINVTENEAEINKEVSQLDPVLVFTNDKGFAASWTFYFILFFPIRTMPFSALLLLLSKMVYTITSYRLELCDPLSC